MVRFVISAVALLLLPSAEAVTCVLGCSSNTDCIPMGPLATCDPTTKCCFSGPIVNPAPPPPPPPINPPPVPPTVVPSSCVDLLNPQTGTSDCPFRAYLCNDSVYYSVMTTQCPRTCNRCGGTSGNNGGCVDLTNPATGVSDCPYRREFCTNSFYVALMRQQCPATCGFCNLG